mmetsp:Transcript_15814/g.32067  ORF Transcript_15814/g.32067 Transcript_15814/m.32067 type:complete len:212 (-) Transcript_15814:626-1261(-)
MTTGFVEVREAQTSTFWDLPTSRATTVVPFGGRARSFSEATDAEAEADAQYFPFMSLRATAIPSEGVSRVPLSLRGGVRRATEALWKRAFCFSVSAGLLSSACAGSSAVASTASTILLFRPLPPSLSSAASSTASAPLFFLPLPKPPSSSCSPTLRSPPHDAAAAAASSLCALLPTPCDAFSRTAAAADEEEGPSSTLSASASRRLSSLRP